MSKDKEHMIQELSLMAQVYFEHGHSEKAAEIFRLIEAIRASNQYSDGDQQQAEESNG